MSLESETSGVAHYICFRAPSQVSVDGNMGKPAWQAAPLSGRFVDIVNGDPSYFDTRAACLWDDEALYVAFWLDEPDVRATLTERDSFIWFDNDAELFIGGDDCYYEFEINAHGTVYEVFFIWQEAHKAGSRFDTPEFDLRTRDVDVLGGFQDPSRYGKHPRGKRWAFMDWDFPGLETAVSIDGTLNDSTDVDKGWMVEMKLPWLGFKSLFADRTFPPKEGETMRMQFFRFESLRTMGKTLPDSPGWCLNPHGAYDSHLPERFAVVHFTERVAVTTAPPT